MQLGQWLKDKYDLIDSILVSRAGMAENNCEKFLVSALFELISRTCIREKSVEAYSMQSVNVWLGREAASLQQNDKL